MTGTDMKIFWYWLVTIEDMWFDKIRKLMEYFSNPKEVYYAKEKELIESGVFTIDDILKLNKSKDRDLKKELSEYRTKGIDMTYLGAPDYPEEFKHYSDKPYALFYKGKLPMKERRIAIVGARNCSSYGKGMCESIAEELSLNGVSVVSGMARGIDKYAHIGCLKGGSSTYAVLGCGVDVCYPKENMGIYSDILNKGAVISEYPPGAAALAWRFPYRNRIISMLSELVLVVEAKEKSGTLITVDYALQYGKDVFALPGRVTDVLSVGCNRLIKSGAYTCTEAEDILSYMGIKKNEKNIKNNFLLEKDFEVVYSLLCLHPVNIDKLVWDSGLNIGRVYEILMKLKAIGMVEEVCSGHYIKKLQ